MKKTKRILALLGAILLFGMYAATLVFALSGSENAESLLMASIGCTIIVPVLLYAYDLVYRVLRGTGVDDNINSKDAAADADADAAGTNTKRAKEES